MKPISLVLAAVCAVLLSLPVPAEAFSARRHMRVYPVNDAVFEVIAPTAAVAGDYWCGAADYAQRALGAVWNARIYIARGRGPSVTTGRRTAVQFTLQPAAAGVTPIGPVFAIDRMTPGDNMTVAQALTFCDQQPARP